MRCMQSSHGPQKLLNRSLLVEYKGAKHYKTATLFRFRVKGLGLLKQVQEVGNVKELGLYG